MLTFQLNLGGDGLGAGVKLQKEEKIKSNKTSCMCGNKLSLNEKYSDLSKK